MQPPQRARAPAFLVLQDSNFRAIWYATILGEVARHMEMLVLGWFILQETESVFYLALVMVFFHLPRPFLSMPAGMVADRFNRHRILLAARSLNILTASGIFLLFVSGTIQPWHAFAASFLHGTARSFEDPSRRTSIFDIVGQGRVVNAMSLENIANTSGKLAGPILAGVLLALVSFTGAYSMLVLVHLTELGFLVRVNIPAPQNNTKGAPVWSSLVEALRYVLHSPLLLGLLSITLLMNLLITPLQTFVPEVGRSHLGVGAALVGLLVASEGIGQLVAAGFLASKRSLGHHGRVFVAGCVTIVVMAVFFVWSPWYLLSFSFLSILGFGQAGFGTMQSTITMLSSPPEMRGRMMGILNICLGLANLLGGLEIGIVAAAFSTQWAISVNGVIGLVLFLPALLLTPLVSERSRQRPPLQAETPTDERVSPDARQP